MCLVHGHTRNISFFKMLLYCSKSEVNDTSHQVNETCDVAGSFLKEIFRRLIFFVKSELFAHKRFWWMIMCCSGVVLIKSMMAELTFTMQISRSWECDDLGQTMAFTKFPWNKLNGGLKRVSEAADWTGSG